jgi:putative ABC transport system ATP-binding protein
MMVVVGPARDAAVEVSDVVKTFDRSHVRALDGISLSIARNEYVAITGPSGSGKSTLLNLLAALDRPDRGQVIVDGINLTHKRHLARYRRDEVGLVFQLHNLLPHLDVRRNIEIAMFGTPLRRKQRQARADDLLASVDLAGKEDRRPPELSGGERQRVAIARALANEPALLLADEPTGSLDPASIDRVLAVLRQLRDNSDVTIVMVTHDQGVAATADRILTIEAGRLSPSAPQSRPASRVHRYASSE